MRLRRTDHPSGQPLSGTQRLEAFSDGIFAIAITLIVLEINVPHLYHAPPGRLRHVLLSLWPSYCAYVFSFISVGIYWANHHYIFKIYKLTDHYFNLLNILFLMCISFVPLPTEVLGEYVRDHAQRHDAVIFYNFGMALPGFVWSFIWFYGSRNYRLIDQRLAPSFVAKLSRQYLMSDVMYIVAVAAAFYNWLLGLVIAVSINLLYILPPARPVYRDADDETLTAPHQSPS